MVSVLPKRRVNLCPLLCMTHGKVSSAERVSRNHWDHVKLLPDLALPTSALRPEQRPSLRRPVPSWRNIYLTDPPVTTMLISLSWRLLEPTVQVNAGTIYYDQFTFDTDSAGGMTLGALVDAVARTKLHVEWHDGPVHSKFGLKGMPAGHLRRLARKYGVSPVVVKIAVSFKDEVVAIKPDALHETP